MHFNKGHLFAVLALSVVLVLGLASLSFASTSGSTSQVTNATNYAHYVHDTNFQGGETTLESCHRDNSRLVVCSTRLTGVPNSETSLPSEPLNCELAVYSYRRNNGHLHADVASRLTCVSEPS